MTGNLYSVRMRAAAGGPHEAGGRHVSGAEGIVPEAELEARVAALLRRVREHALGPADFIQVTVEHLDPARVAAIPSLPVVTLQPRDGAMGDGAAGDGAAGDGAAGDGAAGDGAAGDGAAGDGAVGDGAAGMRRLAVDLLALAGVAPSVAMAAVALLDRGPGLRGAVLMDAASGARLEPDPERGVRVSRLDWAPGEQAHLVEVLNGGGEIVFAPCELLYNNSYRDGDPYPTSRHPVAERVADALAIASKAAWAGVLAELGWSDDPDYTTGYVASPGLGYVRLPGIKAAGVPRGGRVFFIAGDAVDGAAAGGAATNDGAAGGAEAAGGVAALIHRVEEVPVWVRLTGPVRPPLPAEEFLKEASR